MSSEYYKKAKKYESMKKKDRIAALDDSLKRLLRKHGLKLVLGFSRQSPKEKEGHLLFGIKEEEGKKDTLLISFGTQAGCDCEYCKESRWRKEWEN